MKKYILILISAMMLLSCSKEQTEEEVLKEDGIVKVDKFTAEDYNKRGSNHPDAKVIQQLGKAGSNLKKPHVPDFKFEFKDEKGAQLITKILKEKGFKVEYFAPTKDYPTHGIKAKKEMMIEFNAIADLNDEFRKIAEENNGEFLGWGSTIVE